MNKQTAMQELIEEIVEYLTYDDSLSEDSRVTYETIRLRCIGKLEKEKEQIVDACNANLNGLLTNGKDYYDLNFNHHIESEPNTYTNFTPHNANAVAEYNEGLKNFTPNK
jgi:hypothetical protein